MRPQNNIHLAPNATIARLLEVTENTVKDANEVLSTGRMLIQQGYSPVSTELQEMAALSFLVGQVTEARLALLYWLETNGSVSTLTPLKNLPRRSSGYSLSMDLVNKALECAWATPQAIIVA